MIEDILIAVMWSSFALATFSVCYSLSSEGQAIFSLDSISFKIQSALFIVFFSSLVLIWGWRTITSEEMTDVVMCFNPASERCLEFKKMAECPDSLMGDSIL